MANRKSADDQNVYELGYLILPSLAEDAVEKVVANLKLEVSKAGGKELDSESPFKQSLAYTMSKTIGASRYVLDEAYLGWLKFEAEASKMSAIKAAVEKMEDVVRSLIIKAPRETTFTFAKARAALRSLKEKEMPVTPSAPEEVVVN